METHSSFSGRIDRVIAGINDLDARRLIVHDDLNRRFLQASAPLDDGEFQRVQTIEPGDVPHSQRAVANLVPTVAADVASIASDRCLCHKRGGTHPVAAARIADNRHHAAHGGVGCRRRDCHIAALRGCATIRFVFGGRLRNVALAHPVRRFGRINRKYFFFDLVGRAVDRCQFAGRFVNAERIAKYCPEFLARCRR